jgi:hypothetical protein
MVAMGCRFAAVGSVPALLRHNRTQLRRSIPADRQYGPEPTACRLIPSTFRIAPYHCGQDGISDIDQRVYSSAAELAWSERHNGMPPIARVTSGPGGETANDSSNLRRERQ